MLQLGQGGTFDYEAGRIKRAPHWIQKIGMEWLWRLIREPKRIVRQMALPKYVLTLLFAKDKTKGRFDKKEKQISLRKITVEENEAMRLDKLLAIKCEDLSRTMIQKLIQDEKIYVNGKPQKASCRVKKDDVVEVEEVEVKRN